MPDIAFRSATELARQIRAKEIGCVELLDYFLARVQKYNPAVNAIIVKDFDRARERAVKADAAVVGGDDLGPLHGVPMTIKEAFDIEGTPTTWGFPAFKDNIATSNAVAVDRLLGAGAIIFGKTNVPPGLMDAQSANDIYGRTNNPWDLSRTPGGSSGGAAAALAAGLTGLELGSDIASSIRNPAHFCGVFGHKPTYGICPLSGHSLAPTIQETDIAVIGPLARSAADLELTLSIVAGPDGMDARGYALSLQPSRKAFHDFRVALVSDDEFAEVDSEVSSQISALGDFLEREGISVARNTRPAFDSQELYALYMVLLRAAMAGAASDEEFAEYRNIAGDANHTSRDMERLNAYGVTLSHRDWLRLDEERQSYRMRWAQFFEGCDVLLCPPLSSAAFAHTPGSPQNRILTVNGRQVPFENQLFWAGYGGACYLPATVAPAGVTQGGLPVGVQIIGPQYGDLACIRFAKFLEEHYRAFVPPPGYDH